VKPFNMTAEVAVPEVFNLGGLEYRGAATDGSGGTGHCHNGAYYHIILCISNLNAVVYYTKCISLIS